MSLPRTPPIFNSPIHTTSPSAAGSMPRNNTAILPPSPASSRKLHLHVASTGRYFEAAVASHESIAALKESLVGWTHISAVDQILLTDDGTELDSRHNLHHYHAQLSIASSSSSSSSDSSGPLVFVFNRNDGAQRRTPVPSAIPGFELRRVSDEDVRQSCPPREAVATAKNIMMQTLPQYERSFKKHVLDANAYLTCFGEMLRYANNARTEQDAVLAALEAALNNLDRHAKHMRRTTEAFHTHFSATKAEHHSLLESWPRDLERLREVEVTGKLRRYVGTLQSSPALDPNATISPAASPLALPITSSAGSPASQASSAAVLGSSRITLFDILAPTIPRMQRDQDQCAREQKILDQKVDEMMAKYRKVEGRVQELLGTARTDLKVPLLLKLKDLLKLDGERSMDSFTSHLKQLQDHYNQLVDYIEKLESSLLAQRQPAGGVSATESQLVNLPFTPTEAVNRFQNLDTVHEEEILAKFQQQWEWLKSEILPLIQQSSVAVQTLFYDVHAKITSVSPYLSNIEHVVPLNQAALDRLATVIKTSIQPVRMLPSAWKEVGAEIPRRRAFRRAFLQEAQGMATRLHRLSGEEQTRRMNWHKEFGQFLPKGTTTQVAGRATWQGGFGPLVAQLNERPPLLDLSFADFDANLPDLDSNAAMPRSGSHSALPSIDESAGGESSSSSSSSSSTSNVPTSATAAVTTPAPVIPASQSAVAAIQAQFPWLTAMQELTEKLQSLEKENQALKLAATISTSSPKVHSRKNSLGSTSSNDPTSTSSPLTSARHMGEWKMKYEMKDREYKEVHENNVALERELQALKEEKNDMQVKYEKVLSKATELAEKHKAQEKENTEMSIQSAKLLKDYNELRKELTKLKSDLEVERDEKEILSQLASRKLTIQGNFVASDLVVFVRNPQKKDSKDAIDHLEVFSISSPTRYFISPESAARYKQILKQRQERQDEALAARQQAGDAPASSSSSSVLAASPSPSSASGSTSRLLPFGEFIGEIIEVSEYKAEAGNNPFQLPVGEKYHTVTVLIPDEEPEKIKP